MDASILHADLDAFYASVEQLLQPHLRGRPVAVGGGVVLAASYEARAFGVRSGMPGRRARELCPDLVFVGGHFDEYRRLGDAAIAVLADYTPAIERISIDEAFADVSGSGPLFGPPAAIAGRVRARVRAELGLPISIGVARTKHLAKIASQVAKPDGLVVVRPDEVGAFLRPLPIERMWGVGPKTAPRMRELGVNTLGDLADANEGTLERVLGSWGPHAARLARGQDDRDVIPDGTARSIGAEETYEEDLLTPEAIGATLLDHSIRVARRLVRADLRARTVTVKIKYADFSIRSRSVTLPEAEQDTDALHRAALACLARVPLQGRRVRLTGVSVSGIESGPPEPRLFTDAATERRRALEQVSARIADRFHDEGAVTRASLVRRPR